MIDDKDAELNSKSDEINTLTAELKEANSNLDNTRRELSNAKALIDKLRQDIANITKENNANKAYIAVMSAEAVALNQIKKDTEVEAKVRERSLKLDITRRTWTERRLTKELHLESMARKFAEGLLDAKSMKVDQLERALQTHIESRSLIM